MAALKHYIVKVIPKRPACTDPGAIYDLWAKGKREACTEARRQARWVECIYDRLDGPLIVTATEAE